MNYQTSYEPSARAETWACGLRTEPRMVYWPASADLAPYISGFHLYAVEAGDEPHRDAFQPAWGNLRVRLCGGESWRVRTVRGEWVAPSSVSLFGPSSSLTWTESDAGLVVGAGIRPRGWLRLFSWPAREWADRIGELPSDRPDPMKTILERFSDLSGDEAVPVAFEGLLREALGRPAKDEEAVTRMEVALVDPAIASVGELARATGLTVRAVERLAHRAFGFPPKLLLRRARFLRSLHAIRQAAPAQRATAIDPGYTDYSHFIRDSHDFLGMSPQAFLQLDLPLLKQSLVLRKAVLGAPAQALAVP